MKIQNSSDWYNEGRKAFRKGKDFDDCEYDEETEPYNKWKEGWLDEAEHIDD